MLPVSTAFSNKLNSTNRKIVKKVHLYDTKFAVPSNGISFNVYEWTDSNDPDFSGLSNLTLKFPENSDEYGSLPNLSLYWGTGTPFALPIYKFAIKFTGYFYVDSNEMENNNRLNFAFAGVGIYFDFEWDGSTVKTSTQLNTIKDKDYEIVTINNPSVGWHSFTIHIWGKAGVNNGGFTALYNYNYINLATSSILYNGDVSDSITNWSGDISYDTSQYNSSPASIYVIPSTAFGDGVGYAHLKIPQKLIYNKTYTLSFYAKLANAGDTGELSVSLSSLNNSYTDSLTSTWTEYSYTFTIDQKDIIEDYIHFTHNYAGGIYIDDVSLIIKNEYYNYNFIPLNAGVVNNTNDFLSPIDVKYIMELSGSKEKNGYSKYQFTVPLGENGYVLNNDNDFEDFLTGNIILSEGKLIKVYVGYYLDSEPQQNETIGYIDGNKEYIPRATLFIDKFNIDRNKNIITVECVDILSITEQQFCINYPDASSYWVAGYINDLSYNSDLNNFITAYDKWDLNKAIKDLFIKSGIPASLLNGKEYRKNKDGNIEEANYLILDKKNVLEFNKNYGDSDYNKYNYYFDIGTRIHEALMKIIDTYGYILDTRYDGYIRVLESNNATSKFNGTLYLDANVGGGGTSTNYKAQSGAYLKLSGDGTYAKYSFKGNGVSILFVRNINSGASHTNNYYWEGSPSVIINIVNSDGDSVYTKNINLYYSDGERFYYDGIDYNIGDNPCIVQLTQGLDYDLYTMEIKVFGNYEIGIDQIWTYNYKYTNISKTFNTYKDDNENIGTIGTLNFDRGFDTFRNNILIVGKRNTFKVGAGETNQSEQNIIYENIHSKDVDINSVYNSFASNYVGRNMMTYIQEPTISNYAQAKWLSYNILVQYRNKKMHPNFAVYGDPTVEIHDCVSVNDKIIDSLGEEKFWVNGYSESIKSDSWNIEYSLIGVQPFPSYESNTDYDISNFNNNYMVDFTITDVNNRQRGNGYESDLQSSIPTTEDKIYVDDVTQYPPAPGYVVVYSPDNSPAYGLFEYTSTNTTDNTLIGSFVYKTIDDFSTVAYTDFKCKSGYNLYESEDFDNYIKVHFICLVEGEIQIGVKKVGHSGYIAGLSGSGGLQAESDKTALKPLTQKVYPGDNVTVYWGGVDQTGISFDHDSENDDTAGSKDFLADDGDYYIEVKYVNYKLKNTKIYLSNSYLLDAYGDQIDGMSVYAIRSYTSSFDIDVDFVRDINVEYIQGGTGGKMYVEVPYRSNNPTYTATRDSINYIYVSDDKKSVDYNDGDIIIKVKQLNASNLSRKYWIKLKPTVYRFVGKKNPSKNEIQKFIVNTFEFNEDYFNDGTPILLSGDNWKNIVFNPKVSKWGGVLDVDEDFVRFMNDVDFSNDTYYLAYFLLIGVEVIDVSGRRCQYIAKDNEIAIWEDSDPNSFDKSEWNTVFDIGEVAVTITTKTIKFDYPYIEFIWIPLAIDNPSEYSTSNYLINVNTEGITMHRSFAFGGFPTNNFSKMLDDSNHHIMCEPKCDTDYLPFKVCKTK